MAQLRVPTVFSIADLAQPAEADEFRKQLGKDSILRLDLFAGSTATGLERLRAALQGHGHRRGH